MLAQGYFGETSLVEARVAQDCVRLVLAPIACLPVALEKSICVISNRGQ